MLLDPRYFLTSDEIIIAQCTKLVTNNLVFVTKDLSSILELNNIINFFATDKLDFGVIRNYKKNSYFLVRAIFPDETITLKNGTTITYSDLIDSYGNSRDMLEKLDPSVCSVAQWWIQGNRVYFDGGYINGPNEAD